MFDPFLGALLVFALRVCDVSIGTVRVMYTVQGRRFTAALLGLFEAGIFIFAVSSVLSGAKDPWKMCGYAAGFATGTLLGVTVEKLIASGMQMIRVIGKADLHNLATRVRSEGIGVTSLVGEGRDGPVLVLFMVMTRRKVPAVLDMVREYDPSLFITVEPVSQAIGGHNIASTPSMFIFRK